jgi:hypothetical protein
VPPAWRDVWICLYPNGHIQAVGTDEAGRRQYLYHERAIRRAGSDNLGRPDVRAALERSVVRLPSDAG